VQGRTRAGSASHRRYFALAVDFDGTVAHDGAVAPETVAALERLRASGRRLLLVTGRELDDLERHVPRLELFDRVVAEIGALLFTPASRSERLLADPPPPKLVAALQARGVAPLAVGQVVLATWHPHEGAVLAAIHELGLEQQIVFNKGAVMVLPPGINKGTGLAAALMDLGLSPHNTVAVGDAENDHAFLALCEVGVAVANALPAVKAHADLVTVGDHGSGVVEVIDQLLADDLSALDSRVDRHDIPLGRDEAGAMATLAPHGLALLIAGPPGGGKSTVATRLLERLLERGYQCCVIDPEGDYEGVPGGVVMGNGAHPPRVPEVVQLLECPDVSVVVDLLGLSLAARPTFFADLLVGLAAIRARTGRPHWLLVDEGHHLLPAWAHLTTGSLALDVGGIVVITVQPERVAPTLLARVDAALAVGPAADQTLRAVAQAIGSTPSASASAELAVGEILLWRPGLDAAPSQVQVVSTRTRRRRHRRKYAVGDLGPVRSFYFQGPEQQLNLAAPNLVRFAQLASEVDDATWLYHLRRGDYARWFRQVIADEELASEAERIAALAELSPAKSRARLRRVIAEGYTLPD
jgi:hydroxymethylpyrimidine pyrophosphatase-like HAD family hydrolase